MFYHWYYLRFYSSLYCCQLFQHDGVQQESSCYFGHCTQMNLMSFSWLLSVGYFIFLPSYVHLCKYLLLCEIKNWIELNWIGLNWRRIHTFFCIPLFVLITRICDSKGPTATKTSSASYIGKYIENFRNFSVSSFLLIN